MWYMSSPTVVCEDVTDRFGDDIHSDLRLALRQHERWEQTKDALVASGVPHENAPVVTLALIDSTSDFEGFHLLGTQRP